MSQQETVIALGFFDGVHLGHGALLRRAAEEAARRGAVSAVFTFDRPPREVVTGVPCPLINTPEDRAGLARRLYGIQRVIVAPFNREMMTTTWEAFVTDLLVGRFHAVHLVAGHDHRFGHKNQGTPALLAAKCAELGLGCDIIPKVELDGVTVSSTHIRALLEAGEMEAARRAGAQLYVTADVSYHHFFTPEGFMVMDIGHFESEVDIVDIFFSVLKKKFPTFAVRKSCCLDRSNPVHYFGL